MSTNYEAPIEVRGLEKMLCDFSYRNGYETSKVFDDTLRYIMWGFSLDGKSIEDWQYKKEENHFFWEYLQEWARAMEKQLKLKEWYDPFGDLYMTCIAAKSHQSHSGQFFTPAPICDLMSMLQMQENKVVGQCCSDPTCGSGRTLLAWHVRNLGNYLCAEDIDKTCCLMTCCNFLVHGCVGEVIWHNSLDPDSWFYGWRVNENLNNPSHEHFGIPHVRSIQKEESKVWLHWEDGKRNNLKRQIPIEEKSTKISINDPSQEKKQPVQLTLF